MFFQDNKIIVVEEELCHVEDTPLSVSRGQYPKVFFGRIYSRMVICEAISENSSLLCDRGQIRYFWAMCCEDFVGYDQPSTVFGFLRAITTKRDKKYTWMLT